MRSARAGSTDRSLRESRHSQSLANQGGCECSISVFLRNAPKGCEDEQRLTADIVELARQYGRYGAAGCGPFADAYQKILTDEKIYLAKPALLFLRVKVNGVEDNEKMAVILFELGALAVIAAVLDGQLMQAKLSGQLVERRALGVVHVIPAKAIALSDQAGGSRISHL